MLAAGYIPRRRGRNSGCWHPAAKRTGPPLERALVSGADEVGQDGVLYLDALSEAKLRFRRPADLPALADYLVWVRWKSGGSDDAPTWEHRLVRIPAFSRRSDPARRFATFPEVPPGRDFPLDVDEASVIEVSLDDLVAAPTTVVTRFVNPVTGELAERWQPGLGLAPVVPGLFQGGGLELSAGRAYAWRVRVERYGELSADGRQRVAVMRGCSPDADGQEQIDYCRDPRWSEEHRFTLVCAEVDDACPRSDAGGEGCGPAPGRPEDRWTSGCAQMSLGAASANAGGFIDANIATYSGICSGVGVWAVPSDYAIFDGVEVSEEEQHRSIYDFCYDVPEQPKPAPGPAVVVVVPDDWSGTVRFHVPEATGREGCIDYIGPEHGGTCCLWGGGCRAQGEFDGPMVVAGGYGGTHGWSTVRMFSVVPEGIAADPGTP